jgi:hypothetical protein
LSFKRLKIFCNKVGVPGFNFISEAGGKLSDTGYDIARGGN